MKPLWQRGLNQIQKVWTLWTSYKKLWTVWTYYEEIWFYYKEVWKVEKMILDLSKNESNGRVYIGVYIGRQKPIIFFSESYS